MTKAAKGRWKFMMNNMDNNIAEEQKETKSLAEIMESFGKAFLKLWWIAVILMVVAGFLGYYKYKTGYIPMYQSEVTFSITSPEYDGPDETYTDNNQLASTLSVSFNYLINNEVFYEIIKKDLGLSDRKSTRLNSSHLEQSRMPSSA